MVAMFLLWEEENLRYYHFKTSQVFILTEVGRHATIECIKLQYVVKDLEGREPQFYHKVSFEAD